MTDRTFWPSPTVLDRTVHLIGDIQTPSQSRCNIVTDDMTRVPDVPTRITVGDFINSGVEGWPDSSYTPMIEFIESLGTGDWYSVAGNHDAHGRTPEQAAAIMGMPGANFVLDLGHVVFVCMWIRCAVAGQEPGQSIATDTAWLSSTLAGLTDRKVVLVGHPPLYDPRPINSISTENAAILATLDANPNVVAYFCGHTHVPINHAGILTELDTGSRTIAQLNGSALVFTTPGVEWNDGLASLFVTFLDDALEVRFRDHAARRWVGGGSQRSALWRYDY